MSDCSTQLSLVRSLNPGPSRARQRQGLALGPVLVTLAVMAMVAGAALASSGGDPMGLVAQGTRFTAHDPAGSWGYDGQFYYAMARYPDPHVAATFTDVPAYRYQRILFPLLARGLSLGNPTWLPWVLIAIGLAGQALGTWAVAALLAAWGINPWYALIYGLWIGFALGVRYDLPETLAFALAAGGLLSAERGRPWLSWLLFGLALLTKEVTGAFVLAAVLSLATQRRWRELFGLVLVAGAPYIAFQIWLWTTFGRLGFDSGGALSTPFLIVPYMGLWGSWFMPGSLLHKLMVFGLFVPLAVIPSLWGLWASLKMLQKGSQDPLVWGLLINSIAILPLPNSTFSDPRGMLRFLCGLLLSVLLFCARYRSWDGLAVRLKWLLREPLSSSRPSSLP
jgi:hypothetical protein